ncbi:uncharacterized protein LOC135491226 isoform X2 [Lineus longissimus]|uniref:uncharacterized protein LOC135491226 isoform X2 n=1 Tax=Lineus longissimus TaxID=88925 RepID=UPI002B4D35E8
MAVAAETNHTSGSWFPSGFHGHFRSKSRNDFICEYRQLAKPQPPKKFLRRAQENPGRHLFSRHDNRHSFLTDALYFEEGLGRRRIQNDNFAYQRDLLSWRPVMTVGPNFSQYQVTYRTPNSNQQEIKQLITHRPKTSFDNSDTSTYRYSHGKDNPNREVINAMTNEALTSTFTKKSGITKSNYGRESVATCLSWYEPPPRTPAPQQACGDVIVKRPGAPAATATYVHVPAPPSGPKPNTVMHTHIQQVAADCPSTIVPTSNGAESSSVGSNGE